MNRFSSHLLTRQVLDRRPKPLGDVLSTALLPGPKQCGAAQGEKSASQQGPGRPQQRDLVPFVARAGEAEVVKQSSTCDAEGTAASP